LSPTTKGKETSDMAIKKSELANQKRKELVDRRRQGFEKQIEAAEVKINNRLSGRYHPGIIGSVVVLSTEEIRELGGTNSKAFQEIVRRYRKAGWKVELEINEEVEDGGYILEISWEK